MKTTLVATFIDLEEPPSCQGLPRTVYQREMWRKVKANPIFVEDDSAVKPDSSWKCGTDKIYRIVDAGYYRAIGVDPCDDQHIFACKHYLEINGR